MAPTLHTVATGPTSLGGTAATRIVLLHGFTQTLASWHALVPTLAAAHEVVAVDLPGHGGSSAARLDLREAAAAVATVGGRGTYVGYSMGGRGALRLALDHPELVERLVLIGATAGIDDDAERAARRRADEALAASIEADGVAAFLRRWLAQPLFVDLTPTETDLAARRANTPDGLAASLRLCGTATMDPPWWDELARLGAAGVAVQVVAGARDEKFRALGARLVDAIGSSATLVVVPATGHACHLEAPGPFLKAVALDGR